MPKVEVTSNNILDVLVESKLAPSKSEARRLVTQGGISINDDKIVDPNFVCEKSDFVLHKGKKTIIRIIRK